jgi:hypothetical protein
MSGTPKFSFPEPTPEVVAASYRECGVLGDLTLLEILEKCVPPIVERDEFDNYLQLLFGVPGPRGRPAKDRLTVNVAIERLHRRSLSEAEAFLVDLLIERMQAPHKDRERRMHFSLTHVPERGPKRDGFIAATHNSIRTALAKGELQIAGIDLSDCVPAAGLPEACRALVTTQNFLRTKLKLNAPSLGRLRNIVSAYSKRFVQHGDE